MKISRRTAIEALGGAGLVGGGYALRPQRQIAKPLVTATCPATLIDSTQPHINLICHGMMLFWYPLPFPSGSGAINYPDSFYILIPMPPGIMGGMPQHVVALSEYRTGYKNVLTKQGIYQLTWGNSASFVRSASAFYPTSGIPPSKDDRALLYDPTYRLTPSPDFRLSSYSPQTTDNIWYIIQVPYPTFVFPYLPHSFPSGSPAYDQTGSALDLHVNPTTMAGVHVFYYQGITGQVTLNYPGNPMTIGPATVSRALNIHLYSQPELWTDYDPNAHIGAFNAMASYKTATSTSPMSLNLKPHTLAPVPGSETPWQIDADLDAEDRKDLAEIVKGPRPPIHNADPVECLQGWGS